jgi:signal transduction histidine kinase
MSAPINRLRVFRKPIKAVTGRPSRQANQYKTTSVEEGRGNDRGHSLSILNNLRRQSRPYVSNRLWVLGALLALLCALALVQYYWIGEVAQAERQRARTNLTTALAELESDFDIEITRAFAAFELPAPSAPNYSERYKEWLRLAPFPNLVRGVYVPETGIADSLPKAVVPGEPAIRSTQWLRDLADLTLPSAGAALTARAGSAVSVGSAGFARSLRLPGPEVMIDGNPAFIFPIMPAFFRTQVAHLELGAVRGRTRPIERAEVVRFGGPAPFPQWGLVVLDANYIETTFLPRLVKLHFPNGFGSDYDILVVNKTDATTARVVFHSDSAPPEVQFAHPDGSIRLFELRLDCFFASSYSNGFRIEASAPAVLAVAGDRVAAGDSLSGILARRPPTCVNPAPATGGRPGGSWEMLVRYRAGSLDEVMATFRRRSLLLSGGVLAVLALGILMLIVLTERARALAEMQTEFVLGVSHELRTPLTVIAVAADNLRKGLVGNPEQARKYGEIIDTQASELSNMIEETLAFARIQSSAPVRDSTPVFPQQIVTAALANCGPGLDDRGIEVELDLEPGLPPVDVDVRLMNRCLENLIQNAVKYATAGRWMAIRARKVNSRDGERVQISVEDRGPGISPADLPHIFEPFYRGTHVDASKVPGVGLGLTLVKRVVESHHGTVEVKSLGITGTVFSVYLPAHRARREAQETASL